MNIDDLVSQLPVDQLAAQLGVDPDEAKNLSKESVGALLAGMEANAKDPAGAASLDKAVGKHSTDTLDGLTDISKIDTDDGDKIVGHVFGDQRDAVTSQLGGIGGGDKGGLIGQLLPMLAPVVMGWLAKSMVDKKQDAAGAPEGGEGGGGGGIGDMLGGLLGGGGGDAAEGGEGGGGGGLGDLLGGLLGGGSKGG